MNPPDETEINERFADIAQVIVAAQIIWRQTHPKHRQLLAQVITGSYAGTFTRYVDEYQSPQGVGYQIRVRYTRNGNTWQRIFQHGPESHRTHGWRQLIPYES